MSIFGKLHDLFDDDNVPYVIESKLEEAFESYVQAYVTSKTRFLVPYFTRDCIRKISPSILNEDRYFATEDFREVKWNLLSRDGDIVLIEHSVEYKEIKAKGYKVDVSQNYKELWKFNTETNMVEAVER